MKQVAKNIGWDGQSYFCTLINEEEIIPPLCDEAVPDDEFEREARAMGSEIEEEMEESSGEEEEDEEEEAELGDDD